MSTKKTFYTELCYVIGLVLLAFSAAIMKAADLGVSMVVAPPYLLHLKLSEYLPFFSYGMAAYTFQALLLIAMIIVLRRFKLSYLFSFVSAVIYGFLLDGFGLIVDLIPMTALPVRIVFFMLGALICALAISFMFHTYVSPEVYELFVMEISDKFGFEMHRVKLFYDYISCAVSVIMSFAFFGMWHFEGVKLGTIIYSLVNGYIIAMFSKFFEKHFEFKDALKLRNFFK
ncbi:MAG: hypothetical protein IJY27_07235 [Clostridia bacterium]|nr:hypothetical protein [Clostridia bacterium]